MHAEAYTFVAETVERHGVPSECRVLEIGSRDINGGVRGLFLHVMSYTGIDIAPGSGVDLVVDCQHYDGHHTYDLVVSTEVLEHMPNPAELIECAARALAPGGMLILTCAAPERAPHGAEGGPLGPKEHYRGITPTELARYLKDWSADIQHHAARGDLYAVAVLAPGGGVKIQTASERINTPSGMRILVGVLAHQLSGIVLERIHRMRAIDHAGFDVLTMWGQDWKPTESRFSAITRKYQDLQRIFLSGPWDALLTIEQDVLVPEDTLIKLSQLIADGADIAYGLYVWRYQDQHWWSAHPTLRMNGGQVAFSSLSHHPDAARRWWGERVRVAGLGLGCTLISRMTLARLGFHQLAHDHSCDTALALDAQDAGLIQVSDLSVVCGHMIDSSHVVWPDPTAPDLYRIVEV